MSGQLSHAQEDVAVEQLQLYLANSHSEAGAVAAQLATGEAEARQLDHQQRFLKAVPGNGLRTRCITSSMDVF